MLQYRAKEILAEQGIAWGHTFTYEESEFYPVIIKTNNKDDMTYFFLQDENGELFFDGWSKDAVGCIIDLPQN